MARNLLNPATVASCKLEDGKLEELLSDGDKLYLRLRRIGYTVTKSWQFIYQHPITKARQKITRGGPPDTSLAEAREWAEKQRGILNRGDDPKAVAEQEALQKAATGGVPDADCPQVIVEALTDQASKHLVSVLKILEQIDDNTRAHYASGSDH